MNANRCAHGININNSYHNTDSTSTNKSKSRETPVSYHVGRWTRFYLCSFT